MNWLASAKPLGFAKATSTPPESGYRFSALAILHLRVHLHLIENRTGPPLKSNLSKAPQSSLPIAW